MNKFMRSRATSTVLLCLLCVAGIWFFWPRSSRTGPAAPQKIAAVPTATTSHSAATTPILFLSTNNVQSATTAAKTNKFAYRLSNTSKSIGELVNDRKAILLENALIDTGAKLDLSIPKKLSAQGDPGAYIVQARGPIDNSFRAMLAVAGAQIVSYIPNDAYLVSAPAAVANGIAARGFSVIPYEPYYKVQSSLLRLLGEKLPDGATLTLGLFPGEESQAIQQIEKAGGKILSQDRDIVHVVPPADWTALAQLSVVHIVEPSHQRATANDLARVTMGISVNSVTNVNYLNLYGSNVVVEVNDSGIDATHPDFATGRIISDGSPLSLVDPNGHGTHVAGIIAGNGASSDTIITTPQGSATNADFRGKAPLARLLSVPAFNGGGGRDLPDTYLQETPGRTNVLISNNSWIYDGDEQYDLAAASYDAATRDAVPGKPGSQPVLFVFAAGNDGAGDDNGANGSADTITSPGTAKNVIAVGALEQPRNITNIVTDADGNSNAVWKTETDSGSQVASFSSRGNVGIGTEGTFGRFKPDVVAPGTFVVSTTEKNHWNQAAYYNPTNYTFNEYIGQIVDTNSLQYYSLNIPGNAVGVVIQIFTNNLSSPTFPTNMLIYVSKSDFPDPTDPTTYDFVTSNNVVSIPTDGSTGYIQAIENGTINFAVADGATIPVNYDLTTEIITTNDLGNYLTVLSNLNNTLGPYYRYESGTSIAAPAVSGVLALVQDYFTNTLGVTPSPALLKAMLVNGSRVTGNYKFAVTNAINFQGWGLPNLPSILPPGITNLSGASCSSFFADQSVTNTLATGDSHRYMVAITNVTAQALPLRVTLTWTDPPGDPAAAIKLVNNLDLIVTNIDTGDVYYGNTFASSGNPPYSVPWLTNSPPNPDAINNIENIFLLPLLAGNYSVTVVGRSVNVNAVTAQTDNVVQDYALVISYGEGEATNALTVTDSGAFSNPTSGQQITFVTTTNTPLFNQIAGASSPLLGTNTVSFGTNQVYGTNALITVGMTNQWHFYVVSNSLGYPNAAFLTFFPGTLAIPRMGVFADSTADATRPEADIDLYVASESSLTNLDPNVISNCVNGLNGDGASIGRKGTEFVAYTNSTAGQVYYVGVKSEDREAAEFDFLPVFSQLPFSLLNADGSQTVNSVLIYPPYIPDGSPAHPGIGYAFALALYPMDMSQVVIYNTVTHQNFGDLIGVLNHNGITDVLNNHNSYGPGTFNFTYDDSGVGVAGSQPSTGPGSLRDYVGTEGIGPWILTEVDDALTQTGSVTAFSLTIQPHQDLQAGFTNIIQPNTWLYDFIDVVAGYTNLIIAATNVGIAPFPTGPAGQPVQMYTRFGAEPTQTNYDQTAGLTNGISGVFPSSAVLPGNAITNGPPLPPGRYFLGIFNPTTVAQNIYIQATLGGVASPSLPLDYTTGQTSVPDDAVSASTIQVTNVPTTATVSSVNVGMVVNHPRISDLTFTLVSPTGQRVLLMENRGGTTTNGAGNLFITTNSFATVTASGGAAPDTNYLNMGATSGSLTINYNMYTVPDRMTVYYSTNIIPANLIWDTGLISGSGTFTVNFGPGTSTFVTIIMNETNNPSPSTAWKYTAGGVQTNFNYLTFTEDTNLTITPIKYAVPPYTLADKGTNYTLTDFEIGTNGTFATNADYFAPTNIYDPSGGWFLPTGLTNFIVLGTNIVGTNSIILSNNQVSVVTDPANAQSGSNFLALANGTIIRTIPMTVGKQFSLSYQYRGPGIVAWLRGEGNASDSSDPETNGNNGELIGRFNFPAGEVGQAFELEDAGNQFQFAGTNTYVQIHQPPFLKQVAVAGSSNDTVTVQSSYLDVGAGSGFTVEGWISPTNVSFQQPLVEWLARTPTNTAMTNLVISAGPFLDPATGHYYYLLGSTNWTTSEIWATNLGGHLVTIDTANEQNWVYDTFASYGGTNRNLWIGLNAVANPTPPVLSWTSGASVIYTNWLTGQPNNCTGTNVYTAMLGSTNGQPGLWILATDTGANCSGIPPTNKFYGVVEVNNLQPNGVQFWVSVTNSPGTTNSLVSSNGCLYANLVDITNGSHEIFSAPGLIQSNVFQHVALTYSTNSGLAKLYYNGTNVASTNLGIFTPKTTGDVLLGKDMSRLTNNFYGGEMDEMSIYRRALSASEIAAIYRISAFTTNRNVGKFDPTIPPAEGLAEARVSLGGTTNIIFGDNNLWQLQSFTFTATTNSLPLQISGIEPGILLDSFAIAEAPLGNLYYLPEQSLASLAETPAYGTWTLQIWDNRAGAFVTNASQLVSWQLQFVLDTNSPTATPLNPQQPGTIIVPPGGIGYLSVSVPTWATSATNILVSSTLPVDLLYNQTNPPTGSNPGDFNLVPNSTNGFAVLNAASTPPLTNSYILGVRNTNSFSITAVVEVDFNITGLTNGIPYTGLLNTNDTVRYFAYSVSSNAVEATFQLLQVSNNADLVLSKGAPLPTLFSDAYGSFNAGNVDENIYVLTNSAPVPLSPGVWYLGVFKRNAVTVNYSVLAKELDTTSPNIIDLTNNVPFHFTAGPGAALTNFFRFNVTNFPASVRFELYNQSGNGDLTLQTNGPPLAPPFFQSSQQAGRADELIFLATNSALSGLTNSTLTNLNAQWYLGVPNHETTNISYFILAVLGTNNFFPTFPGAEGAGGGTLGGGSLLSGITNSTVYHVTSLADSGLGTLRDAVSSTNRTIVFDVSGTINLLSQLVITNSYLTIAGQTAPRGITVAGNMTTVQSAHDVVIRYLRFRRGAIDDSLMVTNSVNVIADHVSAEWSDIALSALNSSNVTVQWSMLADSLYLTNNPPPLGSLLRYGNGMLSFHHNLYADNYSGNPRLGDNLSLDFVNNVIYDWGTNAGYSLDDSTNNPFGFTNQLNYVCNYLIATTNSILPTIAFRGGSTNTWIFQTNNLIDSNTNHILDGANTGWNMFTNLYTQTNRAFALPPVSTDEAFLAYEKVLDFAGTALFARDSADTNIIAKVRSQTGTFISTPFLSGMVAWWKAEGNALDNIGSNNGTLVGGLGFAPGEVGQAFNFKDTNGYVYVPASPQLNVGASNGLTIEAWINPSNVSIQMPVVSWGTNATPSTNVLAGPILNPANGHFYYLLRTNTWTASEAWAVALGGHLVTINDAAENSWVLNTFSLFKGVDRDIWTGLYDPTFDTLTKAQGHGTNFVWVDGSPVTYVNWASPEPNNGLPGPTREYWTFMYAIDQGSAGQWNDLDNRIDDTGPHGISGVVELSTMPGVQLWTSVTWSGGGGGGSLYANIVDSTNGSHEFSSAAGLIQTNAYQHVALTYNHTTGIASLYRNGVIVASTNLGIFAPKTTGDVLLGKNSGTIYSGGMDEVSIYKRALSIAEIQSIYNAGSVGKFPTSAYVPPPLDSDQDGIPDYWEITLGTDPYIANNNMDRNGDSYTDLEEYLNWLGVPHALALTNTPAGVDLYKLAGNTGNLSFSVTNGINGSVYLTNVLGSVTNTGPFSNSFAIFTPTNNFGGGTNYGYASFDFNVTNNDTHAYFGPVTVSVMVSAVPVLSGGIVTLTNMVPYGPVANLDTPALGGTNSLDYYVYDVSTNAVAVKFEILNASSNVVLFARYGLPLPPATGYPSYSTNAGFGTNALIYVTPASSPMPLAAGKWYLSVSNATGGPVTYTIMATEILTNTPPTLSTNLPPQTINEGATLTVTNTATDTNAGVTLTYTVTMVVDTNTMNSLGITNSFANTTNTAPTISSTGVITWTPSEAQGPGVYIITTVVSDNSVPSQSATNSFRVTVNELNRPPFFLGTPPNQTIPVGSTLIVTNTAGDFDLPTNPLTYALSVFPAAPNATIDTNTGVITWTPTLAQAGTTYTFTTIVTDTNRYAVNAKSMSATNFFTVTVIITAPPFAFTQPATAVTGTSAQLNGMATANGLPATAWFQWGTDTNYVTQTPPVSVGTSFNVFYTNATIGSLTPNVPYHFRLVVSNSLAVTYGFDQILDEANVVAWGANYLGQGNVPSGLSNVVAIAGAYNHSLALKNNETVVAWGDNTFNQTNVPSGLNNNLVAIAGGESFSIALKNSGTVVAWGGNSFPGETNVPSGLNGVVTIASGQYSSLALKNSGNIVAWGANISGLTNVPSGLSNNAVAVAGGSFHSMAIKNDGTVVAWGDDSAGQTNVPAGLTNVVAISAGSFHSLALKADGTIVAWGDNSDGQTNVPAGLNNVVAIAAGGFHCLALKRDGSISAWGDDSVGQQDVAPGLTNFVAIAAGYLHSLALTPQSIAGLTNIVLNLTNGAFQSNSITAGGITYYKINVPTNADFATNILFNLVTNELVNVWFTTNIPPSITATNDRLLLVGSTNATTSSVLSTTSVPTNIVPGGTYYLGVQNTNSSSAFYGIEVDFHLLVSTSAPVYISSIVATNNGFLLTWFAPSNDLFQVQWNNNLGSTNWQTFTNPPFVSYNTNVTVTNPANAQFNFFDDNSQTGGSSPTRFYRLILLSSTNPPPPLTNTVPIGSIASTTNGFLLTWFAPSNDLFKVQWTPSLAPTNWQTFTNPAFVSYNTNFAATASNAQFNFLDDGSQTGGMGMMRFYRLILFQSTNSPSTNTVPISSIFLNGSGLNLQWSAPTNDQFSVRWTTNLAPTINWTLFTNIITSTNGTFLFTDTNAPLLMKFYQLILLP